MATDGEPSRPIPYTARVPRNPSGDAGSNVVPPSTSTGGSERSAGPKRPPRPKAPAGGGTERSNRAKKASTPKKAASSNGGAAAKKRSDKPAATAPAATVVDTAPPGFAGAGTSPPTMADPTTVDARTTEARPSGKERPRQKRPAADGAVERTTGGRRGRRVTRVVRRIELWSVLKLSLVLFTCLYLAVMGTLVVVWGVAYSSGQVERLQEFLADVGLENFRFYGDRMFKAVAAIGAVTVLAGTILAVLTTALINLISEMTGGIRVVVIEEERPPRR